MTRARAAALTAALAPGLALACAPAAPAYVFIGRWPGHTVRYFDATKRYKSEVRAAARAWNRSGARIRWVAVPRRRAQVVISLSTRIPTSGLAIVNGRGRGRILLRPNLRANQIGSLGGTIVTRQIVAHEMGHIIGLGHEARRCAVMSAVLGAKGPPRCPEPKELWRRRCRLLERDDIAGAMKLYGGRVRLAGSPFCAVDPPPAPASNLKVVDRPVDENGEGGIEISWTNPPRPRDGSATVLRRLGSCPRGVGDAQAHRVGVGSQITAGRGATVSDTGEGLTPGRWCYLVVIHTSLGQPGRSATAFFDYAGRPPVAGFDAEPSNDDPNLIAFSESSRDPDGRIVAWSWSFGDGGTSNEQNPSHRYPGPGAYTVSLTVTDNSGQTASASQTVVVQEPAPAE